MPVNGKTGRNFCGATFKKSLKQYGSPRTHLTHVLQLFAVASNMLFDGTVCRAVGPGSNTKCSCGHARAEGGLLPKGTDLTAEPRSTLERHARMTPGYLKTCHADVANASLVPHACVGSRTFLRTLAQLDGHWERRVLARQGRSTQT